MIGWGKFLIVDNSQTVARQKGENMKKNFQVVIPNSYQQLCQLVRKVGKQKCDCNELHLGIFGQFIFVLFGSSLVVLSVSLIDFFFLSSEHPLSLQLSFFISLVSAPILGFSLLRLYQRDWMRVHAGEVIKEFIPEYLEQQISSTNNFLFDYNKSSFGLVRLAVAQVIDKGSKKVKFVQRFLSGPDVGETVPPHLAEIMKEGLGCCKFQEAHSLFEKTINLVEAYLEIKRKEVKKFKNCIPSNLSKEDCMLAQELWLREARDICESLNELISKFNQCLDESWVSKTSLDIALSQDMEKTAGRVKYGAEKLLQKLTDFYGVKPDESKEESSKPDEGKASEASVEGAGLLTEEDWKELEELDLSSLGKR